MPSAKSGPKDIFYAEWLRLNLSLTTGFSLIGEKESSINFVESDFYFYPKETYYQDVLGIDIFPEDAELSKDNLNNYYVNYFWKSPKTGYFKYGLNSDIKTANRFPKISKKIPFPIKSIDKRLKKYVAATPKIDITPEIISQASYLAEGEDDLYKVSFKLASWVRNNINYSLNTLTEDASQKASWVLENKYGVCDELTNLFIAMARSLGIPARFVSGVSYTDSDLFEKSWGLHGWAEVFFPGYGWVAFDPTYGQYGNLDAGHIKLRHSLDSDKSSASYSWQSYKTDLVPDKININVNALEESKQNTSDLVEMNLKPFIEKVGFGSYNLIELSVKNKQGYYIGSEYVLSKTDKLNQASSQTKYILLAPYEEKKAYWIVKVNESLKKNYIYKFPIKVYNSLGGSEESYFNSSSDDIVVSYSQVSEILENIEQKQEKAYSKNVDMSCNYPNFVYVNEKANISCTITNTGNIFLRNISVCIGDECSYINLGISRSASLNFSKALSNIGENTFIARAKNKDINVFGSIDIVLEDLPNVSITNISYPSSLYGNKINANNSANSNNTVSANAQEAQNKAIHKNSNNSQNFTIGFAIKKESYSIPLNLSVVFEINGEKKLWRIPDLKARQKFLITLDKYILNPTENYFKINITYFDKRGNLYSESFYHSLELGDIGFFDIIRLWLAKIIRLLESSLP